MARRRPSVGRNAGSGDPRTTSWETARNKFDPLKTKRRAKLPVVDQVGGHTSARRNPEECGVWRFARRSCRRQPPLPSGSADARLLTGHVCESTSAEQGQSVGCRPGVCGCRSKVIRRVRCEWGSQLLSANAVALNNRFDSQRKDDRSNRTMLPDSKQASGSSCTMAGNESFDNSSHKTASWGKTAACCQTRRDCDSRYRRMAGLLAQA